MIKVTFISADGGQQQLVEANEGDCLLGVATRSGTTRFYFNGTPIGVIDDPQFGRVFFGIWLSPATSQPALRSKLIGEAK